MVKIYQDIGHFFFLFINHSYISLPLSVFNFIYLWETYFNRLFSEDLLSDCLPGFEKVFSSLWFLNNLPRNQILCYFFIIILKLLYYFWFLWLPWRSCTIRLSFFWGNLFFLVAFKIFSSLLLLSCNTTCICSWFFEFPKFEESSFHSLSLLILSWFYTLYSHFLECLLGLYWILSIFHHYCIQYNFLHFIIQFYIHLTLH